MRGLEPRWGVAVLALLAVGCGQSDPPTSAGTTTPTSGTVTADDTVTPTMTPTTTPK